VSVGDPLRIIALNQIDLPIAPPLFDLLLALSPV